MRAAVKSGRVVAAVGAAAPAPVGDQSGLTPAQLLQFAEWVKANPNINTIIQSRLPVAAVEGTTDAQRYRFLLLCEHCGQLHSSDLPWCPASLSMAPQPPLMDCSCPDALSKHERGCTCAISSYDHEFGLRLAHRQRAHADQLADYLLHMQELADQVTREAFQ